MVGGGPSKFALYIFNIRICPSCQERIYSIFVFGPVPRNKYIQYSYSVGLLETNIFNIHIRQAFWCIFVCFFWGQLLTFFLSWDWYYLCKKTVFKHKYFCFQDCQRVLYFSKGHILSFLTSGFYKSKCLSVRGQFFLWQICRKGPIKFRHFVKKMK